MRGDQTKPMVFCKDVHGIESPCSVDTLIIRPSVYAFIIRHNEMIVIDTIYGLTLPGGRIEVGERHDAALKREVFEETNVRVKVGAVCGVDTSFWYHKSEHFHYLSIFIACEYEDGELGTNNQSEQEREWRCKPFWVPIDTAIERGFALTANWRSALDTALGLRR